jgi:hypothetical protein
MKDLKIIYKNNKPYGIRDSGGLLFTFMNISKYDGQEERYRREVADQYKLADDLLGFLESRTPAAQPGTAEAIRLLEEYAGCGLADDLPEDNLRIKKALKILKEAASY